jgi:hypothetical protein
VDQTRRGLISMMTAAFAIAVPSWRAVACAFDGAFDGSFGSIHPRSIEVALAVRRAVDEGLLPQQALTPLTPGAAGLWQATEQLKRLGRRLSVARKKGPDNPPDIALLLSESGLWARYLPTGSGFESLIHAAGSQPSDIVVVADLAVLSAIDNASLSVSEALERSLIIIDARGEKADAVATILAASARSDAMSAKRDLEDRSPWGRTTSSGTR